MKSKEDNLLITEVPFVPDEPTAFINEINVHYKPVYPMEGNYVINTSNEAYKALLPSYEPIMSIQEMFIVLYLNRANRVIGIYSLSKGGITGTVADIRLLLGVGLKCLATSMIISHNHPSGSLKPSKNDEMLSEKIVHAAKLMDINVVDHLILTESNQYFSFSDEGLL